MVVVRRKEELSCYRTKILHDEGKMIYTKAQTSELWSDKNGWCLPV